MSEGLSPRDVDRIADAVAARLAARLAGLIPSAGLLPAHGYVDAATVAKALGVSADFVRAHAAELGAVRLGGGQAGALRFDVEQVRAYVDARRLQATTPKARRRPGRKRGIPASVDLDSWLERPAA